MQNVVIIAYIFMTFMIIVVLIIVLISMRTASNCIWPFLWRILHAAKPLADLGDLPRLLRFRALGYLGVGGPGGVKLENILALEGHVPRCERDQHMLHTGAADSTCRHFGFRALGLTAFRFGVSARSQRKGLSAPLSTL